MKLSDKGGADFDPAPAGSHIARCVGVFDVGTQHFEYLGKPKAKRNIRLTFELPFEKKVFDEKRGEEPLFVSGEFTASLNEKATLRGLLAGWRGRDFTDEELAGFEARNLLNQPCMLTLVHETKKGKTYANINSISKLPKGPQFECPPAINPLVYFSLDPEEYDVAILNSLPEWLQKKIKASDEFKEMTGQQAQETQVTAPGVPDPQADGGAPIDDDEILF